MGNIINHPYILKKNTTTNTTSSPKKSDDDSLSFSTSISVFGFPPSPKSLGSSTPTKLGLAIIINSLSHSHESKTFDDSDPNYNHEKVTTLLVPQFIIKINNLPTLSLYYCAKKPNNVAPKEIIEMSEEYTRITFHGGPKSETTHLFGDCVLECRPKEFVFPGDRIYNGDIFGAYQVANCYDGFASASAITPFFESGFLKTCYACDKNLAGYDVYIYRGDASFCSTECRFQEIMLDKHNETMRKKMEKLGKKKMNNNEDIKSKKVIFSCGGN